MPELAASKQILVRTIAEAEMNKHGLLEAKWSFQFNKSTVHLAQCWHDSKVIAMSMHMMERASASEILECIKHEIAHALVGPGKGHDEEWQEVAELLGIEPKPCGSWPEKSADIQRENIQAAREVEQALKEKASKEFWWDKIANKKSQEQLEDEADKVMAREDAIFEDRQKMKAEAIRFVEQELEKAREEKLKKEIERARPFIIEPGIIKENKPLYGEKPEKREVKIYDELGNPYNDAAKEVKKKAHVPPLKAKCPYCEEVIEEISRYKIGEKTFIKSANCKHIIIKDNISGVSYDNWISGSGKIPYPYQVDGFKFIERSNGRCLIADEPGLGKTVQALSFLNFHREIATPALWLCKTTLKIQTLKENIDWCGFDFATQIIEHSKFFPLPGMKLYISSYDLLKRIKREKLEGLGIKTVIFDEVQHIKNPESARTQEVRNIVNSTDFFIALSGTPWKNRGSEYYSVLNMLAPEKFPSYKSFVNKWVRMDYDPQTGKYKEGGIRDVAAFREYTKDFILRRLRKDVLPDLPPINRQIRYVELEDIYGENYEKAEGQVAAIIKDLLLEGGNVNNQRMGAEIMKLKHITGLAKVDAQVEDCISFLEDTEDWEKITIFHHHIDVGDDLQYKLDEYLLSKGYERTLRLKGGDSADERNRVVESFKRNEKRRVLIASTLASGEGLNLQFCQNASMMERQWNPANEEQAELRFSRPLTYFDYPKYLQDVLFDENQTANKVSIRVPYLICANTVDEMLNGIIERKRVNFRQSMNPGDEELKFSEAEMVKELAEAIVRKRYGKAA